MNILSHKWLLTVSLFSCLTSVSGWAETEMTDSEMTYPAVAGKSKGKTKSVDKNRLRVLVTSDGEIDDECSMVRFLLYANEWDIEGIVTSSSEYHWHGHNWAGDDWMEPYLEAYEKVYPNLLKHDKRYPTPAYLRKRTVLGNVESYNDMDKETAGSNLIVNVLLNESDPRPVWVQAWGGTNTIARALKTIEEKHPEKMQQVAGKLRFYFIWEQDDTYQTYIRPHWGKYNILTIISDQFEGVAYRWKKWNLIPKEFRTSLEGGWMKQHILQEHGPLCGLYKSHPNGDFRSEGDSPAYFHVIPTGLRGEENPDWGGWGGRYVKVRGNMWLDPVPVKDFKYPDGKWDDHAGWTRSGMRAKVKPTIEQRQEYYKPIWRWIEALQNDFAARADWCLKPYEEANHEPVVKLACKENITASSGKRVKLSARGTSDPDGDRLTYRWWQYTEADSYAGKVKIESASEQIASVVVPADAKSGNTIHIICEVTDNGTPVLTRYARVVITVK